MGRVPSSKTDVRCSIASSTSAFASRCASTDTTRLAEHGRDGEGRAVRSLRIRAEHRVTSSKSAFEHSADQAQGRQGRSSTGATALAEHERDAITPVRKSGEAPLCSAASARLWA
jgi:hypothetical protein